jgi:hypothetical protein
MARSGSFSEQFAGKFNEGLGYFLTMDWSQSDPLS